MISQLRDHHRRFLSIALIALLVVLSGCTAIGANNDANQEPPISNQLSTQQSPTPTPTDTASSTETPTPTPTATPATPDGTDTPTPTATPTSTEDTSVGTDSPTGTATPTPTPTPTQTGTQTQTSTSAETESDERVCPDNPYNPDEQDEYEYDTYNMKMPDRFAEDILETDGVTTLYYGTEDADAGLIHYVETESGTEPVVYCEATDGEGYIHVDYDSEIDSENQMPQWFTPQMTRWTANPTYEKDMGISDQSVDWLLNHDHVESVESQTICHSDGDCETRDVTVSVTGEYPPEDYYEEYHLLLPDHIDGYDITYRSVDGDG